MNTRETRQSAGAYLRRDQILDGFYELLKKTPYEDITVSDLCAQVGVARKIFYRNYRDKRDCICALIDKTLTEIQLLTAQRIKDWTLSLDSAAVIMECWKSRQEFLDIMVSNHFADLMIERAILLALTEDTTTRTLLERNDMPCDEYILTAFLCCHFTLILQWHFNGFATPVEEMAQKYLRIAIQPMVAHSDIAQ